MEARASLPRHCKRRRPYLVAECTPRWAASRVARATQFRYRAATRVDTLGGNADDSRRKAAFDVSGAGRQQADPEALQ